MLRRNASSGADFTSKQLLTTFHHRQGLGIGGMSSTISRRTRRFDSRRILRIQFPVILTT